MTKRALMLTLSVCLTVCMYGQTETTLASIAQTLDSMYEDMDGSLIPTGYLKDKAIDLVKLSSFTGQELTDSNYVDPALYRDLFRTMNYARKRLSITQYNADSIYSSLTQTNSGNVKLSAALFMYNYIVEDAIENNLVTYNETTHKVGYKYINNVWQDPFDSTYVFMFVCGRQVYDSQTVTFDLTDLMEYTNCDLANSVMEIDYGDGIFESVTSSTKVKSYGSNGTQELKLKVTLNNSTVLISHTFIEINQVSSATSGSSGSIVSYDAHCDRTIDGVTAHCYAKFHPNHNYRAIKPFIYVEGFDHPFLAQLTKNSLIDFYNLLTNNCSGNYNFSSGYNLFYSWMNYNYINNPDFDYFYVDWDNPEADITTNAELLVQIIRWINSYRPYDKTDERSILFAHSMGGLVSRCALCQMEDNGEKHKVGCFVSQDVPYTGAVVPIGAQYAIRDIYQFLFGADGNGGISGLAPLKTVIDRIVGVLDSTAARQMMLNYVDDSGGIDNDVHYDWQSDLNIIGFPSGDYGFPIENLAIASGGSIEVQELAKKILSLTLSFTGWKQLCNWLSISNMTLTVNIDRDRQPNTKVSQVTLTYTHLSNFLPPIVFPILNKSHYSDNYTGQYDVAYGSYLAMGLPDWLINPLTNSLLIPLPNLLLNLAICDKVLFVPSGSALSVNNYTTYFYNSVINNPGSIGYGCPFSSFCLESTAQRHDTYETWYFKWLFKNRDLSLIVPPVVTTGDIVSVTNRPSSILSESYTISGNSASLGSANQIAVNSDGVIEITYSACARDSVPGQVMRHYVQSYTKKKKALTCFPQMTLSHSCVSGSVYSISAECTNAYQHMQSALDELAESGDIKFVWCKKNSSGSIVWSDTTSVRSCTCTAPVGDITRIYMKVCIKQGREGEEMYDDIDRTIVYPFFSEPGIMTVSDFFTLYNYNYLSLTTPALNHYYCVWHNSNYIPSAPAPDNIIVKGDYIPLTTSYSISIDGETKTVYCFDFLQSPELQDAIDVVLSNSGIHCAFIPIQIRNGTTVLQNEMFYVEKPTRPFPDLIQ